MEVEFSIDAQLSFRNGETLSYFSDEPTDTDGYLYRVMLLEAPLASPWIDEQCTPYTVLCAAQYPQYENRWGWIGLDAHAKRQIGYDMLRWMDQEPKVKAGTWYWMLVETSWREKIIQCVKGICPECGHTDCMHDGKGSLWCPMCDASYTAGE